MKHFLLVFTFFTSFLSAQTQIGGDITSVDVGSLGASVAFSANGNRIVVGAPLSNSGAGLVQIYELNNGLWTQVGANIDGESSLNIAGGDVSISADGTRVAFGAVFNDESGRDAGNVRIFEESGGVWSQVGANLLGEGEADQFGGSVALSADGTRIAIGGRLNDGNDRDAGHVRIFEENGGVWTQIGADIDGEATFDQSGASVSFSTDGTRVAIGAGGNDGNGSNSGHVRIFEESGGVWTQIGADINGVRSADGSGRSVSLSSDGTRVAIGAPLNDENGFNTGHLRIFEENGGNWTQVGSSIRGGGLNDNFGGTVALSGDGTIVAGRATGQSKYVRVYEESGGVWTQMGTDINGQGGGSSSQPRSINISANGARIAVGASSGPNGGLVRVYSFGVVLPVELLNFTAHQQEKHTVLEWETTNEIDNDRFSIEHAVDGLNWSVIGEVIGAGTGITEESYSFRHESPAVGKNYYRLQQIDFDGTFNYSKVVTTVFQGVQEKLSLYPNPTAGGTVTIAIPEGFRSAPIQLLSVTGKLLQNFPANTTSIDLRKLPPSTYLLRIETRDRFLQERIVVQ